MEEYHSVPREFDNDNGNPSSFFLCSDDSNNSSNSYFYRQFDNTYIFQYDDSQNNIDIFNNQAIQGINNNIEGNRQSNQENNNNNNQINPENNNINSINRRPIFGIIKDKRPNQTIANITTRYTTSNKNGNVQIEKVKEKQKDENNNKIEGTFHDDRNFRNIYLRNFFDNLLGFIDYLIEDCYKNIIISPIPLKLIKKEYFILHNAEEQYNMLDKKAIDFLKIDINNKVIKDGKEKDVELYNQKLLWSYKGENAQKEKLLQITSVLNKKIGYLMEVYLGKVIPEEDYYQHFVRFKEYLSNLKRDNDYKEKLKNVAEVEFKERLNIVLFNDSHKRGRKAQIKNNV